MPSLTLFLCANSCAVDRFTNNLSIFELLDTIAPLSYPALLPKVVLVCAFAKNEEDAEKRYRYDIEIKTGEQTIFHGDIDVDFGDGINARNVTTIQGVPVLSPGDMTVSLLSGDLVIGTYTIRCGRAEVKMHDQKSLPSPSRHSTTSPAPSIGDKAIAKKTKGKTRKRQSQKAIARSKTQTRPSA